MKASDTSTSIVSHRTLLSPARPVVSSVWARRLGCLLLLGGSLAGGQAQTANWTGGNSFLSYGTAANWSPATVPLNQVGLNYTVIVPDSSSLVYNIASNGVIDALSFGAGSTFRLTNQFGLLITGPALVKGQVEATGSGSFFRAPTNTTMLSFNPRLYATGGGQIQVGASTYSWDRYNASATLLSALGTNSLVDIKAVSSMTVSYGDGGSWAYYINARTNGVIDLSGLTRITGPGQDDWLEFNQDTGGTIKFDSLYRITGQTRFNLAGTNIPMPALNNASGAYFNLASNSTLKLPSFASYDSATFTVGQNSTVQASNLVTMDSVALTMANNSAFLAPSLAAYRNSDIPIQPGRNFQAGLLTDLYGSRIWVSGGSSFTAGALTYDTPGDWRWSPTLFSSDGAGSVLNLSAMKSLTVQGGWGGAFHYYVTASSNGVINFSGLETITGARSDAYDNEDWLNFTIRTGGNILFNSLRQVSRRTQFNIQVPQFDMPALQTVDTTLFSIADGCRLNATNLTQLDGCSFNFGFNSTLNAPRLGNVFNTTLAISPGVIVNVPPFTNIYASRFTVSGGTSLQLAATSYDMYSDWRGPLTLFGADGAGSLLNGSSLRSIRVYGGHSGAWTYSVSANNNGIVDLSALETTYGADPSAWGSDDWLGFSIQNGGNIRLDSLKTVTRRTRFDIGVPLYQLPALETADNTAFNVGDGSRLNLPLMRTFSTCWLSLGLASRIDASSLSNLTGGSLTLGQNSTFNAPNLFNWDSASISLGQSSTCNVPNLLNFQGSDLAISPGRVLNAPYFTNIYSSRFAVSGGSTFRVAAPTYALWEDWRTSATLFSSDGAGSTLDLSSLQSLRVPGAWGGAFSYSITANNSGLIDLSGLQTVTGCRTDAYDNEDWLTFNVQNNGQMRLNSLQTISGRSRFNISVPQFDMPSLQTATNVTFTLADATRLAMTNLTTLDSATINFGFNSIYDVPQLRDFVNTTLSLSAGRNFNAPPFTNIYASLISVSGGSVIHVAAPSYDLWPDWRWSPTLFSADGTGSQLDMAALKSFTIQGAHGGAFTYSVTALNGGVVDLSGLDMITGARTDTYANDDWLRFSVDTAGTMKFGNASTTRRVQFIAVSQGSRMQFAGLYLRPYSALSINSRALLEITGNSAFENTDPASIVADGAFVQMDGSLPQTLEVGSKNLGASGSSSGNFGYGQLIIGSSNQTSTVLLVDAINNGQRGTSGEPEGLYLYGVDGQGLRILNGSRLFIGTLPVYALIGGTMRSLASLIPAGTNSVAYDGGFIAATGGPRITNMTPAITVNPPVSSVDVSFDIPIKASTFTAADVTITGPSGPIAATSVIPVSGNTYRINFSAQTANGLYTLRVGPNVDELAANLSGMDQNGNGVGGEASDVYTNSFTIDGIAPVVVRALALQNGTRVGITFDEPVSPAFATNPANYLVNGLAPTNAVLQTNGFQVALSVSALVGETFALTVNNLTDLYANTTSTTVTGAILTLESRDIGSPGSDPREIGSTVTFTGTDFTSIAGGSGIWTSSDAFHFVFERRTGDFDVRAQIARLDRTGGSADAGLTVRESLTGNSRKIHTTVEIPQNGGTYYPGVRYSTGANVYSPYPYIAGVDPNNANIPNAWIRMRRVGSVFSFFRGTNGTDWIEFGRVTNDFPTTAYLGLSTCADNNTAGQAITATYLNYTDITPAIIAQPQSQSVVSGVNVSFGVTARGLPTLAYQWTFNGVVIANATNNLLALTAVTTNNVGDYRVIVTNSFGSITSLVASLVVDGVGAGGFEADVSPTPYGNNSVSVSDWVRVGRLVAGLDSVLSSSEFQRADCAPRTNTVLGTLPLGDGRLSVADWTQAGRYAAGLDPLTPAGGTNQPSGGSGFTSGPSRKSGVARQIRVSGLTVAQGQTFVATIELLAAGNENAVGFSLNFDPTQLAFQSATAGTGAAGASMQVNANQSAQGRLGFVFAKQVGQSFAAGSAALVEVRFTAIGATGPAPLSLGDLPVVREIASITADVQAADYLGSDIRVIQPAHLSVIGGDAEFNFTGQEGELYRIEASTDLIHWELLDLQPAAAGPIPIDDPNAGLFRQRFYRVVPQP